MSYVGTCANDLFISYAHFDDTPMFQGQKGWIEVFHQALEVRLRQLLGEAPTVWRDPSLSGNEYFRDTLDDRLVDTALLLSVVSPRYVKSESCLREIDAFCRAATQSGGIRFADKARLLKVVKTEVAREQIPAALQPLLGYEFYALDQAKRPREYRLPPSASDEHYQACLDTLEDLAYDIKLTLESLKSLGTSAAPADQDAGPAVYVAETVSELRPLRDQIVRELRQRRFVVFPCEAPPERGDRYREFVAQQLDRSALSVHLLGSLYGTTLEGESRSTIEVQIEEAGRGAATGTLRRVLWMQEAFEAREERQRDFVDSLQQAAANERNTDLVQTSVENLKTYLLRKLSETARASPSARPADTPSIVYLIHDQRDVGAVDPLREALMTRGYEVKPSYFDGDETELRAYHQDNLVDCDGVVIYYGAGSELWVQRKLADLRKAFGLGRTRAYRAKAVLVGAPATAGKSRFRTQEATLIQATDAWSPDVIEPFVQHWLPDA